MAGARSFEVGPGHECHRAGRSRWDGIWRGACFILVLGCGHAVAQPVTSGADTLRIFVPPPLQWDNRSFTARAALQQGPHDLALINGGIVFGMTPGDVAKLLPGAPADLTWNTLRSTTEYPADVRYFWMQLSSLPAWREHITHCVGASSYVAFQFASRGLFRVSFRLLPDAACPSVTEAALDVFARYVRIGPDVALSVHYTTLDAAVVDITDPTASFLIPIRWRMSRN